MSINRFSVDYSTIIDPGSVCSNPTITYAFPQNITIPCSDSNSVDIEINTDVAGPYCLTFIIDCSDSCSTCPPIEVTKCFCVNPDDCENCANCESNVCVSRCPGQYCDNDTCVDCDEDHPCPQNQECSQGVCRCPADKPIKRADGKCVECLDGQDLGPCRVCIDGTIVSTDCPNGVCNPITGDCQECYNNTHCTEPNQCCNEVGVCDCCPGYMLDPVTNECVLNPPCTNAQYCIDHFGPCYYCTEDGCQPKVCPNGGICDPNTGECQPPCVNGVCPEGSGCLNGRCVPCSELSCSGVGELCQFAAGCQCVGNACEYINCNQDTVDLQWVVTPGTPGTPVPGSGLPTIQGATLITPTGLVILQPPAGAAYMNHSFNLTATNGTSGTWTLYHDPSTTVSLGTGTSVLFDLEGTATGNGPNLIGFIVKFVETGTGRTATWSLYRNIGAPITAENVWNHEFTSTGTPPNSTGGMSGSVKLCSTNGNFTPTGVTNVVTTGSIMVTFFPSGSNCLIAVITGCGTWSGDVILSCGGTTVTVPAPSFTKDPSNCCDPTDPNCDGWSTGDPCNGINVQNIDLVSLPTYGVNGNGDGEFLVYADWTSAGLTFLEWFFLNPSEACWSSTGDFSIVTNSAQSPFGPSPSNLGVIATLGSEGCIRLGHTCDLLVGDCKKLQGEKCLTICQSFFVDIIETGVNTYTAVVSNASASVSFEWVYPGLVNNTGQTVTITPVGGVSAIVVHAYYGAPVRQCTTYDSLALNYQIAGCTNAAACNYMSTATVDDNSCVIVGTPTWDCALGGFQDGGITTSVDNATIQWTYLGNPILRSTNFDPGTYTVILNIDGQDWCPRTLVVPQCYRCDAGTCIPAPVGENIGLYTTTNCNNACACDIEINVTQVCSNNQGSMVITATGDTGAYTVTVNKVGGPQVLAPIAMTSSGSVTTPLVCNGVYRILVQGANCNKSRDYSVTCGDCAATTAALTSISYDCPTNQLFATIVADTCATSYTIQLRDELGNVDAIQSFISAGAKTIPLGVYPGDGHYDVRLFTSNGCIRTYPLDINCNGTLAPCPIVDSSTSATAAGSLVTFENSFILTTGGGSYTLKLRSTTGGSPGGCSGAVPSTVLETITVTGVAGANNVTFTPISVPVATCYAVEVIGSTCSDISYVLAAPGSVAPPVCSLTIPTNGISYDTSTGNVLVNWSGANTTNDVTVQIQAVSGGVCNLGDPIVVNSVGNGEDGANIPFGPIHQIQGTVQCITVTIYDTGNPSCTASDTFEIPACTCSVEINGDSIVIDPDTETVEFTTTTRCTSGVMNYDLSGGTASASGTGTGSTTGVEEISDVIILSIVNYPSTGEPSSLEISDDADAGCTDTEVVALPENCTSCEMVATFMQGDSVVTSIVDFASNVVVSGSYDLAVALDRTNLATDAEAELIGLGANICSGVDGVTVNRNTVYAGMSVHQDSDAYVDLNYAEITNADWIGAKKVYFGDCGCGSRLCDYTAVVDFSTMILLDAFVNLGVNYGVGTGQNTGYVGISFGDLTDGVTPSELIAGAATLKTALENAAGCNYTVGTVTIAYDAGLEQFTIDITGTNAGLGLAMAIITDGSSSDSFTEFTQSGCV